MTAPKWLAALTDCGCDCQVQCAVFDDDFNRTNNSSLGTDWTETDWSIASNRASCTTSNALCITTAGAAASSFTVQFKASYSAVASQIRLIFAYLDASNYLFCEFTPAGAAGACGTIKFFERVAGVETQVGTTKDVSPYATSSFHVLRVCYHDLHADAYINDTTRTSYHQADYTGTYAGRKAGFGTGTITGTVQVEDFNFDHHEDYNDCQACTDTVPCAEYRDTFTRSDSTNLGCEWDELAGSWEILSNRMRCTSSNGVALVVNTVPEAEQAVSANVIVGSSNDKVRLIVRAIDENNYLFGEATISNDAGAAFQFNTALSVGQVIGGVETILRTSRIGNSNISASTGAVWLRVCYYGNTLNAGLERFGAIGTVGTLDRSVSLPVAAPAGFRIGAGTGAITSNVRFDDFEMYTYQKATGGCLECAGFCTRCDKRYQPYEEYVADLGVFGATNQNCNNCTSIGGEYTMVLRNDTGCTWSYFDCDFCGITAGAGTWGRLGVSMLIEDYTVLAPNQKRFVLTVSITPFTNNNCTGFVFDESEPLARYVSAPFDPDQCQQESFTMTRTAVAAVNRFCRGETGDGDVYPATITVSRP